MIGRRGGRGEREDSLSFAAVASPPGAATTRGRHVLRRIRKHSGKRRLAQIEARGTSHGTRADIWPNFGSNVSIPADRAPS
jgi:hypothetical protein